MRYKIILKIDYDYHTGASGGRHQLRLLPANIQGRQHRMAAKVSTEPQSDERGDFVDFYGNEVTEVAFLKDHHRLSFMMKAEIECMDPPAVLNISPSLTDLASEVSMVSHLGSETPHHFLCNSPYVRLSDIFKDYALSKIKDAPNVLECVKKIGLGLFEDIEFDAEATTVNTPIEHSFEARHGVCQDISHIMIACLRSIGIPAGYVSGFIRTIPPEGQQRLEGADAMHAWVKAWCGSQVGWIEFDPTNGIPVATDHIIVGSGRDYDDVAPIKGVLKAYGPQNTTQAVDVIPQ